MCSSSPKIPKPEPTPPPPPPPTRRADRMRPSASLQARSGKSASWGYDTLVIPMNGTGTNIPGT